MKIKPIALLSTLLALAFTLTSCIGGGTSSDPDKHPDAWKRKEARYNSRHNGRQF